MANKTTIRIAWNLAAKGSGRRLYSIGSSPGWTRPGSPAMTRPCSDAVSI